MLRTERCSPRPAWPPVGQGAGQGVGLDLGRGHMRLIYRAFGGPMASVARQLPRKETFGSRPEVWTRHLAKNDVSVGEDAGFWLKKRRIMQRPILPLAPCSCSDSCWLIFAILQRCQPLCRAWLRHAVNPLLACFPPSPMTKNSSLLSAWAFLDRTHSSDLFASAPWEYQATIKQKKGNCARVVKLRGSPVLIRKLGLLFSVLYNFCPFLKAQLGYNYSYLFKQNKWNFFLRTFKLTAPNSVTAEDWRTSKLCVCDSQNKWSQYRTKVFVERHCQVQYTPLTGIPRTVTLCILDPPHTVTLPWQWRSPHSDTLLLTVTASALAQGVAKSGVHCPTAGTCKKAYWPPYVVQSCPGLPCVLSHFVGRPVAQSRQLLRTQIPWYAQVKNGASDISLCSSRHCTSVEKKWQKTRARGNERKTYGVRTCCPRDKRDLSQLQIVHFQKKAIPILSPFLCPKWDLFADFVQGKCSIRPKVRTGKS